MSDAEKEAFELVEELNNELYERIGEKMYNSYPLTWSFNGNGYWMSVEFCGMTLWDSEGDGRKWIENEEGVEIGKEPLRDYLLRELSTFHTLIGKIINSENEQTDL